MIFFEKITGWFKEKRELIDENMKIRRGKFDVEQKLNSMIEDVDNIKEKYIKLLEEKSEKFDLYVKYENLCISLAKDKKELKKQLAESNEKCNMLTEQNEQLEKKVAKSSKKTPKKTDKSNEKSA